MDDGEVSRLIAAGEGQQLEFKAGLSEQAKAFETMSAFANADGGRLLFGVRPDGTIVGVSIGANTLENLANELRKALDPPNLPRIETVEVDGKTVIVLNMPGYEDIVTYANGRAVVRVGRTNQPVSSDEQRRRHSGRATQAEESPTFDVQSDGGTRTERAFEPNFRVRQASGDLVPDLEWRIRGPRFEMDWRWAQGTALDRTHFVSRFDLTAIPKSDRRVGENEMGFEIRFPWARGWRHELHRWPISRRELTNKTLWDIGRKILPPQRWRDHNEEMEDS